MALDNTLLLHFFGVYYDRFQSAPPGNGHEIPTLPHVHISFSCGDSRISGGQLEGKLSEEKTNNIAWPIVVAVTSSLAYGWSGTVQREWPETCSMSYVIMRGIQLHSPSSTSHDMYKGNLRGDAGPRGSMDRSLTLTRSLYGKCLEP